MPRSFIYLGLLFSTIAGGVVSADPLNVSVSGRFSSSDTAGPLVAPGGQFFLQFVVDSMQVPAPGSVTSLGFDVPLAGFWYALNGSPVHLLPGEIRFNTAANGGLFDVTFGSGLSASDFSFEGVQAFTGTTAAPVFSIGTFALSNWTYSDPSNFDTQSPSGAAVSLAATPEPSSNLLIGLGTLALAACLRGRLQRLN